MRRLAAVVLSVSSALMTGCINVEQTLTLERNLAGRAGFSMNFDMEPMVGFMIGMQRSMQGKTGAPTAAELAEARKEFLSSGTTTTTDDFEKGKKEFQNTLPPGVTLVDASFKEDGLKVAANFMFAFDQVSKLSEIKFPKSAGGPPGPGASSNPVETPFNGLRIVDEGSTLVVSSPATNPLGDQQAQMDQMPMDGAMKTQLQDLLKDLRVAFKITAPFTIVEHNAHRREGTTLIWDYNIQTLQRLTPEQTAQGIRVRYRK